MFRYPKEHFIFRITAALATRCCVPKKFHLTLVAMPWKLNKNIHI